MKLKNSQIPTNITKKEMTDDYNNYYLAHCQDGITYVRKYRTMVLENIYQNIDLVLYSNTENKFQYDFLVKPVANPNLINFTFDGANNVEITTGGDLFVETPFGTIEQKLPVANQLNDLQNYINSRNYDSKYIGTQTRFIKNEDNCISFAIDNYDKTMPLVIDPPTRLWGTYYGGSSADIGNAVAKDGSGNVYLAGRTQSTNAIASSSANQTSLDDGNDAVLVKFNSKRRFSIS